MAKKNVADHFIMSDESTKALGQGMVLGSFIARLFIYSFMFIIISGAIFTAVAIQDNPISFSDNIVINNTLWLIVIFVIPFSIFFLKEKSVRKWRRKNGYSIYKAITPDDLQQMEIDKRVAMEKKAYEKAGVHQSIDKNDIGYWFDLKEKGAITEEEFLAKKKELL